MTMRVGMNNAPQQGNSNEAAQIDNEIKALQLQLERVQKDESMPPEDKMKKIMAIQVKMMMLQARRAQAAQKTRPAYPVNNVEKTKEKETEKAKEAEKKKDAEKADKNVESAQSYDKLELSSDYLNIRSRQQRQNQQDRQNHERTPDGRMQWVA